LFGASERGDSQLSERLPPLHTQLRWPESGSDEAGVWLFEKMCLVGACQAR
jgi:hypothetical protein